MMYVRMSIVSRFVDHSTFREHNFIRLETDRNRSFFSPKLHLMGANDEFETDNGDTQTYITTHFPSVGILHETVCGATPMKKHQKF